MLQHSRGIMHRIHFDGNDYYLEKAVFRYLGLKNKNEFREQFGQQFTFCALSITQRNQLADAGLAPNSMRNANGVLILCSDVDRYLESQGDAISVPKEILTPVLSTQNNDKSNQASDKSDCPPQIVAQDKNTGISKICDSKTDDDLELLSVKLEPCDEVCTCNCKQSQSEQLQKIDSNSLIKSEKKFVCPICPFRYEFPTNDVYMRHVNVAHPNSALELKERAEVCSSSSRSENEAKNLADDSLKCRICFLRFDSLENLQFHQTITQHLYSLFKCEFCTTICLSEPERDEHVKKAHPASCSAVKSEKDASFQCIVEGCNSAFKTGEDLYVHVEKAHFQKVFICGTCFVMFRYKEGLAFHSKRTQHAIFPPKCVKEGFFEVDNEGENAPNPVETKCLSKVFTCSGCGKKFVFERTLFFHKRNCQRSNIFNHNQGYLRKNVRKFVSGNSSHPFKCPICSRSFTSPGNLWIHKKSHENGGFSFRCRYCPQLFRNCKKRRQHEEKSHPGEFQANSLKREVITAKDLTCSYCGMVCITKAYLADHEDSHAGIQRHVCKGCSKRFTYLRAFTRHMRQTSCQSELTSKCQICFSCFKNERCLKIHAAHAHSTRKK